MTERLSLDCPICLNAHSDFYLRVQDHFSGEFFAVHQCRACQGLYLKDPPLPERIVDYYHNNEGGKLCWEKKRGIFSFGRGLAFSRDVSPVLDVVAPQSRVLDLGTGDGSFAHYLHTKGYQVFAGDTYDEALWGGALPYRKVNINGGDLKPANLDCNGAVPDLITMRHVFEHLYFPGKVLSLFHQVNVPYVLLIVPNTESSFAKSFNSSWYYWDPPRHLTYFTPKSLESLCAQSGYRVLKSWCYGIDEIVVSLYRGLLLRHGGLKAGAVPSGTMAEWLKPTGTLAALSSALSFWGKGVCCCLCARAEARQIP